MAGDTGQTPEVAIPSENPTHLGEAILAAGHDAIADAPGGQVIDRIDNAHTIAELVRILTKDGNNGIVTPRVVSILLAKSDLPHRDRFS